MVAKDGGHWFLDRSIHLPTHSIAQLLVGELRNIRCVDLFVRNGGNRGQFLAALSICQLLHKMLSHQGSLFGRR